MNRLRIDGQVIEIPPGGSIDIRMSARVTGMILVSSYGRLGKWGRPTESNVYLQAAPLQCETESA